MRAHTLRSIPKTKCSLSASIAPSPCSPRKRRRAAGRAARKRLKELGAHPESGAMIKVMKGRYGPYVSDGDINATLPREMDPLTVTLDQAVALIAERIAKGGGKKPKRAKAAAKPKAKPKDGREERPNGKKTEPSEAKAADAKPRSNPRRKRNPKRNRSANLRRWMAGDSLKSRRPETKSLDKARVLEALATEPHATKRDLARKLGVKGSERIASSASSRNSKTKARSPAVRSKAMRRPAHCRK